ncbi:hypothetical protein [Bradyrhizobium sp. USDA 4473]
MSWWQERGIISRWLVWANDALAAAPVLVPATIAGGECLSSAAVIPRGMRAIAAALPPEWDASDISFQISFDNVTFYEATSASETTIGPEILPGAGRANFAFFLPVWSLLRAPYLKIRSGSAANPTPQVAERIVQVIAVNHNSSDH